MQTTTRNKECSKPLITSPPSAPPAVALISASVAAQTHIYLPIGLNMLLVSNKPYRKLKRETKALKTTNSVNLQLDHRQI
jgi:hypothetical protein